MTQAGESLLRRIPSVDVLVREAEAADWARDVPRAILTGAIRETLDEVRGLLTRGACGTMAEDRLHPFIVDRIRGSVRSAMGPHFRKVVNAAGIILHTGLGRAVLPRRAIEHLREHLGGYSLLQVDTAAGKRSQRDARIEWLLRQLTGAEAATVVNNNAAATMLVLNAVGRGREIIVSRGQLVEIGGSFRLPEVFEASGARLVEVGTTNKTHLRDYERAITEDTAAILRVHPSNYKIMGFSSEVPLKELAELAHSRNLPVIDDVGAGAIVDFARFGFQDQPTLPDSIRDGADLTTSSTDKLIGGPQGGIILGRRDLVAAIRKNPLARILRVDKLTLAVLETTLTLLLDEATALREIPTLAMLMRPLEDLGAQAERIAAAVRKLAPKAGIEVVDGSSQMGSGSLPTQNIPTRLVSIDPPGGSAEQLAARLRCGEPPVFTRIQKDRVLMDPRTLQDGDEALLVEALGAVLRRED